MDSEGYYTYYYCSAFTQQERKQLKELVGSDLFRKGCVVINISSLSIRLRTEKWFLLKIRCRNKF